MADPMKAPAGKVGQIETNMTSGNIGKKEAGGTHKYKDMPSASKSGSGIMGPGKAGEWKK